MTDDLVGRLKASVTYEYMPMKVRRQLSEAAARIEALEAAISTIMARCEAIEDEAADGLAKDNTPHAEGFQSGERYVAKSIRRHLHDLTRVALTPEVPHAD